MNVAKRLENISVLDPAGQSVRLGDLWRDQTVRPRLHPPLWLNLLPPAGRAVA